MLSLSLLEDLFSDIVILSNRFELEEDLASNEILGKPQTTCYGHYRVMASRGPSPTFSVR